MRTHEQYGFELICAMPGNQENEQRLHAYFGGSSVRGREYYSTSEYILEYIEKLLDKGFADPNPDIAEHFPELPFSVWGPEHIGNGGAVEVSGQHSIFDLIPVRERIALKSQQLQNNSITDEWYTPEDLVQMACAVLGRIDTDPATSAAVNAKFIKAKIFYTKHSNGLDLSRPWSGSVWLNPPYGKGEGSAGDFVYRLGKELDAGNVEQALTCLNVASMSSKWFYSVVPRYVKAHCIINGRPNFHPPQGVSSTSSPTKGIVVSYFGPRADKFCKVFEAAGQILMPIPAARLAA